MFEEQVLPVVRERAGQRSPAPAGAQDRVHVGERRRPDPGPALQDLHEPAHHDPLRARPGRAAPHRGGPHGGRGRGAARGAGRGHARAPARPHLQRGRPRAAGGGGGPPPRARPAPRPGRVVHGRPARRPAHRRARGQRLPRARVRDLQQPLQGRGARRRARAPRAPRARSRNRWRRRWRRGRGGRRAPRSAWASPGIAGPDGGTPGEAGGPRLRRPRRGRGHPRAPGPLPRRPRAGALPGHAVRAGDAAARAPRPRVRSERGPRAESRAFVALHPAGGVRGALAWPSCASSSPSRPACASRGPRGCT